MQFEDHVMKVTFSECTFSLTLKKDTSVQEVETNKE